MITACGGGNSGATDIGINTQPIALLPSVPTSTTGTTSPVSTPTSNVTSCEGQNGSITVPRVPGILLSRELAVGDLSTLQGDYCNNSTGSYEVRNGSPAQTITRYGSCNLKVDGNGRFTLTAGDKTFTTIADGSAGDQVVGGAETVLDPSLSAFYLVSADDRTNGLTVESVRVGVHRGRVVSATGVRPN